jgi:hypothetical protein
MLKKSLDAKPSDTSEDLTKNLIYFRAKSLPHLLALLFRPPKCFPPEDAKLLIIDSVSAPFPSYFPNPSELKSRLSQSGVTDKAQTQWLMNRKWNVTSDLGNQLVKLAATHRLAVLLVNQTHTRIKGLPRATLCPFLGGGTWENSIYTRIVIFRDFLLQDEENSKGLRFAEVMKRAGRTLSLRLDENIVPFTIETVGAGLFLTSYSWMANEVLDRAVCMGQTRLILRLSYLRLSCLKNQLDRLNQLCRPVNGNEKLMRLRIVKTKIPMENSGGLKVMMVV